MVLNTVLTWIHVFSAVGWLGAALLFGMLIGPLMPKLSPATRSELILKLFPKYLPYVQSFAVSTLIFGAVLAVVSTNGNLSIYAPTNLYGFYISIGVGLALVSAVFGFGLAIPSAKKILKLTREMTATPGPPPPEMAKASRRLRIGSTTTMVLLIVVLVFMVAAANP